MNSPFKTRIAPTPSGFLHQGNLLNFLLIQSLKEKTGASIHLRIDDGDQARVRDEYIEDIFQSLKWLKMNPDSGPSSLEDFKRNHSQRTRDELYKNALGELRNQPGLIYSCECSRKKIQDEGVNLNGIILYNGTCRELHHHYSLGTHNLKINTCRAEQRLQNELGDFVIWKKEGEAAYQLSSLVDDLYYDINFVIRGEDLSPSTLAQRFLKNFLAPEKTIHFYHHPLLKVNGEKISKSQGNSGWSKIYEQKKTLKELKAELNFAEYEKSLDNFLRTL